MCAPPFISITYILPTKKRWDTSETEYRFCELRADPDKRELAGRAIVYGDVADLGTFRETFRPGAFGDVANLDIILNRQHQRAEPLARTGGGGLELRDSPEALEIVATLPEVRAADDVLELVKRHIYRGLSIEFRAVREHFENGVRVVTRAALGAIGVEDRSAYPLSTVAAREANGRRRLWLP